MNIERIKELTLEIDKLKKELDSEKEVALLEFRGMSQEDRVLCENKIGGNGVIIQYFPQSEMVSVDTNKLKEDGLYHKYSKTSVKSDYIKVNVSKEGK